MVALGGTGSTDGGMGLLAALGAKFIDRRGRVVTPFGDNLGKVAQCVLPSIKKPIIGLCDVQVPLLGERGAVAQFGIQKGIAPEEVGRVDAAMDRYAKCVQGWGKENWSDVLGAGAAGGMGFGILATGGSLQSGAEVVAQWCDLDKHILSSDWVITGEGKIDSQTTEGKVVSTVVHHAARFGKPVIAVVGNRDVDLTKLHEIGLTFVMPLVPGPITIQDAMIKTRFFSMMVGEEIGWLVKALQ